MPMYLTKILAFFVLPFSFILILSLILVCSSFKAYAELQEGVFEQISRSEAAGKTGKKIFTVKLDPGYGVNLSFPQEIVSKVWFDNPGIASLDSNGCLSGLGPPCKQEGANILHLRSIKPINLEALPRTSSSLLTVVTKNSQGHNIYLFRIIAKPQSNQKNIHTIEIVEDSAVIPNELPSVIASQRDFNTIHRGLINALNQNLIEKNSPLWKRIISFSTQVRSGTNMTQAAQKAGISMNSCSRNKSTIRGVDLDAFNRALTIQGNYDFVGNYLCNVRGNCSRLLGTQFNSSDPDVRKIISNKPGSSNFLSRLDAGKTVNTSEMLEFFSDSEQQQLAIARTKKLLKTASQKNDPYTGEKITGERLVNHAAQMNFAGEGIPIDSAVVNSLNGESATDYGHKIANQYHQIIESRKCL